MMRLALLGNVVVFYKPTRPRHRKFWSRSLIVRLTAFFGNLPMAYSIILQAAFFGKSEQGNVLFSYCFNDSIGSILCSTVYEYSPSSSIIRCSTSTDRKS